MHLECGVVCKFTCGGDMPGQWPGNVLFTVSTERCRDDDVSALQRGDKVRVTAHPAITDAQ